ncbi:hypothetical protein VTJ04DRAFT_4203 [Mycothermus thermophilus]|uniref:uncharacterized protein n=1 Tax=Humicola insolens TaxID=85995 RepID=UPI00374381FC
MTRPPPPTPPPPLAPPSSTHLLHGLPTELLVFVINNLDLVEDVAALARTSRRLYSMANPYLYRRAAETGDARPLAWGAAKGLMSTLKLALAAGIDPNHEFVELIPLSAWKKAINAARDDMMAGREKQPWAMWPFNRRSRDPVPPDNGRRPESDTSNAGATSAPPAAEPSQPRTIHITASEIQLPRRFYALHLAARGGHTGVIDLLLRHGAAVDVQSTRFCACTKQYGLLNTLENPQEETYPDPDDTGPFSFTSLGLRAGQWTPLHAAICHGQTEAAQLLLGRGKATPLMESGASGADAARDLDTARYSCYGATALHHAAAFGLSSLVSLILDEKIIPEVDASDDRSLTPLYHAYAARRWDSTIPLLLKRGADINYAAPMYIPYTSITALGEACRLGDFEVADRLIDLGADVRKGCLTYTKPGCLTPLHLCCMRSAQAPQSSSNSSNRNNNDTNNRNSDEQDTNSKNSDSDQVDDEARGLARMRTIGKLIERGAQLDARDCFGSTPLMAAVQARNTWAIEALRRVGAGPEHADPRDLETARARMAEGDPTAVHRTS